LVSTLLTGVAALLTGTLLARIAALLAGTLLARVAALLRRIVTFLASVAFLRRTRRPESSGKEFQRRCWLGT
jgi:hypothetical protein